MTKKLKVIVIPTEDKTNLFKREDGRWFSSNINPQTGKSINSSVEGYYMYLVDESAPIQVGDWYLFFYILGSWELMQCKGKDEAERCNNHFYIKDYRKKIIATNNPECNLPNIPLSAIEKWIEQPYEYVKVEMEPITTIEHLYSKDAENYQIKVVDGYVVPVWDKVVQLSDSIGYEIPDRDNHTMHTNENQQAVRGDRQVVKTSYKLLCIEYYDDGSTSSNLIDHDYNIPYSNEAKEEAAENWIDNNLGPSSIIKSKDIRKSFIAGAKWKEEQIGNEAIEFAKWVHTNNCKYLYISETWIYENAIYNDEELYNIYKQSKQ